MSQHCQGCGRFCRRKACGCLWCLPCDGPLSVTRWNGEVDYDETKEGCRQCGRDPLTGEDYDA